MMVYDITSGPYAGDRAEFERNACKEGKSAKDLAEDDLAKFKIDDERRGHERHLRAVLAALLPLLALLRHGGHRARRRLAVDGREDASQRGGATGPRHLRPQPVARG